MTWAEFEPATHPGLVADDVTMELPRQLLWSPVNELGGGTLDQDFIRNHHTIMADSGLIGFDNLLSNVKLSIACEQTQMATIKIAQINLEQCYDSKINSNPAQANWIFVVFLFRQKGIPDLFFNTMVQSQDLTKPRYSVPCQGRMLPIPDKIILTTLVEYGKSSGIKIQ